MASAVEISCRDFLTLKDDQLADLVQKFQRAEGYVAIPVKDLDNVSDKDMQRIRTRLLNAQELMIARAVPLDLDRVNELLMMDKAGAAARFPSFTRDSASTDDGSVAETEAEDVIGDALANERRSYDELVADGGRPLYPIEMLESVAKDPEQHRHLLQPYWRHPGINYKTDYHLDWEVFQRQLRQHKAFRNWQLDNRGIIEEPDFDAYVEQHKAYLRKHCRGRGLAEIEANPESLKGPNTEWEEMHSKRARERRQFREQGCSSFDEYHAALQRRLAAHGLSEKTTLLADPRNQDALTEWHEYLGFECWWQDQYTREYKDRLKRYDQNWNFIQRQKCVTSDHTLEYIQNCMGSHLGAQRREARREIEKAKSKVEKARQHIGLDPVDGSHKDVTPQALGDALQQLAEAEKKSKELDRLYTAIAHISVLDDKCSCAKDHVDSQPVLIQWVIDQIPLIKAEMKVKTHGSAMSGRAKKRTREDGEDAPALQRRKVRRLTTPEETAESEATATHVPEEMVEPKQTATLVPSSSRDNRRSRKLARPQETAELEAAATGIPEETVESEQTTTVVPSSSRDDIRSRKLVKPQKLAESEAMATVIPEETVEPEQTATLVPDEEATLVPEKTTTLVPRKMAQSEPPTLVPEETTLAPKVTATFVPQRRAISEEATLVPAGTATFVPRKRAISEEATLVPQKRAISEEATLVPQKRAISEEATLVPTGTATSVPRKRAISEEATLVPQKRAISEEATFVPAETTTLVPKGTATLMSKGTATLVPESVSRRGLRPRDKSDTDQMSSVAQPRKSARLSAKHNKTVAPTVPERAAQPRRSARLAAKENKTVAPTVPERKTSVKKPARSATTRKEKRPSTKVDTDTGKRAKRGGNNCSTPVPGK